MHFNYLNLVNLIMASSDSIAGLRASAALENVTGEPGDYVLYIGNYSAGVSGNSIYSVLGDEFVKEHDVSKSDTMMEFFDAKTGALVIIPKKVASNSPSMMGADD